MTGTVKVILNNGEQVSMRNVSKDLLNEFRKEEELDERVFEVKTEKGEWKDIILKEIAMVI